MKNEKCKIQISINKTRNREHKTENIELILFIFRKKICPE
jgi:hypothetical protein